MSMVVSRRRLLCLALAGHRLAPTGCVSAPSLANDDPYPGTGSSDGTSGSASEARTTGMPGTGSSGSPTGETDGCDPELSCRVAPPPGWTGPVAVAEHDAREPSACQGPFAIASATAFADLVAPGPACACDCGTGQGGSCRGTVDVRLFPTAQAGPTPAWPENAASCTTEIGARSLDAGGEPLPLVPSDERWASLRIVAGGELDPVGGSCEPPQARPDVPAANWGTSVDLCLPTGLEPDCSGGACLPEPPPPFDGRLCIWAPGDQPCPEDEIGYERRILHRGFVDDRGCSACSCVPGKAACPTPHVVIGREDGDATALPADESCTAIADCDSVVSLAASAPRPTWGPCVPAPGAGKPLGAAIPTDPITLCCIP